VLKKLAPAAWSRRAGPDICPGSSQSLNSALCGHPHHSIPRLKIDISLVDRSAVQAFFRADAAGSRRTRCGYPGRASLEPKIREMARVALARSGAQLPSLSPVSRPRRVKSISPERSVCFASHPRAGITTHTQEFGAWPAIAFPCLAARNYATTAGFFCSDCITPIIWIDTADYLPIFVRI